MSSNNDSLNTIEIYNPNISIVSVNLVNGKMEVVKRDVSQVTRTAYHSMPSPDRIWKEIYSIVDGQIKLTDTITGTHNPAHIVSEKITFG